MAWMEIHQTLPKHPKTLHVAELLRVDRFQVVGHLIELWAWAYDNVPADGSLGSMSAYGVAIAAGWTGDPAVFTESLITARFLDVHEDGMRLHNWNRYAGRLLEAREVEKVRSQSRRERDKQTTSGRPANDHRSTDKRPAVDRQTTTGRPTNDHRSTGGNSTVPNSTEQNKDKEQGIKAAASSSTEYISYSAHVRAHARDEPPPDEQAAAAAAALLHTFRSRFQNAETGEKEREIMDKWVRDFGVETVQQKIELIAQRRGVRRPWGLLTRALAEGWTEDAENGAGRAIDPEDDDFAAAERAFYAVPVLRPDNAKHHDSDDQGADTPVRSTRMPLRAVDSAASRPAPGG